MEHTNINFEIYKDITFEYPLRSYRIIDGDTVEVRLDLGFLIGYEIDIRINGIETPEVRGYEKLAGKPVAQVVQNWFDFHVPHKIFCEVYSLGKYGGRAIGDFYSEGTVLSNYLLTNDLAKPYSGDGKVEFSENELLKIKEKAHSILT